MSQFQVFKFGGASVKDAKSILNVAFIIKKFAKENTVVVVSAMGKTTNALEDVVDLYFKNDPQYLEYLNQIKEFHLQVADQLFKENAIIHHKIQALFDQASIFLQHNHSKNYAYVYDQVVSVGELASSRIISDFLNKQKLPNQWLDARELIRTNNNYTEATVDWNFTTQQIKEKLWNNTFKLFITQGFLGGTTEQFTTTLGREGSDFTGAIFASVLEAQNLTVWKDVSGILNADPKKYPDAQLLDYITYREVIEMTYYGAKVIHPRTIQPLQQNNIPLYVKSFVEPEKPGTVIGKTHENEHYPPIIVHMDNQLLLSFYPLDFSFVAEELASTILKELAQRSLRVNMVYHGAVHFSVIIDDVRETKIKALINDLQGQFEIKTTRNLEMLTIRHYAEDAIKQYMPKNKTVLFEQKTGWTMQRLLKNGIAE